MEKSPEAFRTISEVAEFLETPAHVLRFWESRFPQIRPVKRAGGRRYYRPGDVALLSGIKRLLHDEGMTIRGVQKILREQGIRYVAALSATGDGTAPEEDVEAVLAAEFGPPDTGEPEEPAVAQTAQIISLERALARQDMQVDGGSGHWPPDPGDEPAEAGVTWPQDPEDPIEAPFADVDDDGEGAPVIDIGAPVPPGGDGENPEPAPAQTESSDEDAESPADAETGAVTAAALLRQLAPGSVAHRRDELRALHQRLYDLRERLARAARRRAR